MGCEPCCLRGAHTPYTARASLLTSLATPVARGSDRTPVQLHIVKGIAVEAVNPVHKESSEEGFPTQLVIDTFPITLHMSSSF